jgi:hypothetical protein
MQEVRQTSFLPDWDFVTSDCNNIISIEMRWVIPELILCLALVHVVY